MIPRTDLTSASGAEALSAEARALVSESLSANTRLAYTRALNELDRWLKNRELSDPALAEYCAYLHSAGLSPATISLQLAAVRFRARFNDQPKPDGALTHRAMRGIQRTSKNRGRGQAAALRWRDADMAATMAAREGTLLGLRDAALILVGSDALLRVSELVGLTVDCLSFEEDGSGRVLIRRSKTDAEGAGAVLYLRKRTVGNVHKWLLEAGIDSGAVFRRVLRGDLRIGDRALNPQSVGRILKRRAFLAGLDPKAISGHSLRIGAAQSLVHRGATLPELQQAGRWESPVMPGRYARKGLAGQSAVARLRDDDD